MLNYTERKLNQLLINCSTAFIISESLLNNNAILYFTNEKHKRSEIFHKFWFQ